MLFSFSLSDYTNISRFLNRILGIEVELQNRLFAYFVKTLSVVVQQAKRSGRWDEGILGKTKWFMLIVSRGCPCSGYDNSVKMATAKL